MNLNTQQLMYLVEIERTHSISQAAANLFMGQPNLSRILRELEEAAGFPIFERTRKGVLPTEKGAQFLNHARMILRETEFMERLGSNCAGPNRFRICIPRSFHYAAMVQAYLSELLPEMPVDAVLREGNPRMAFEKLGSGQAEIAVIRFSPENQAGYEEQAQRQELCMQCLTEETYRITLSSEHPLAGLKRIPQEALAAYPEILHREHFTAERKSKNGIFVVDRLTQTQLLRSLPGSYLWSEALPEEFLQAAGLVQRPGEPEGAVYQTALLYKPQCAMSPLENGFLDWIREHCDMLLCFSAQD